MADADPLKILIHTDPLPFLESARIGQSYAMHQSMVFLILEWASGLADRAFRKWSANPILFADPLSVEDENIIIQIMAFALQTYC